MDKETAERIAYALEGIFTKLDGIYELLYIITNKILETLKK